MANVIFKYAVTIELVIGYVLLAVCATTTWSLLVFSASYLLEVSVLYSIFALILVKFIPDKLWLYGMGWANRITIVRAILSITVFATVFHWESVSIMGYWWTISVAIAALSMDALDGWVARYTRTESSFGARLDMEVDAFLLLSLSLLVFLSGKVGFWIVFLGLIRYCFVICGLIWPFLEKDLPMSWRRKVVCVIQGIALVFCLAPATSDSLAVAIGGSSLGLLMISFWIDIRWLYSTGFPR
jgi:phosphatidylglycerophosphate synthase